MNTRRRILILQIAVVTGICAFLFFFGLGAFGFVGADEPRYAQIAREMFNRHDWIVPTLNGQPWLEKPPFLYWKISGTYSILGVVDWAARVPVAFHALALVLVLFLFMRRFRPGTEMDAALITTSSAAMIGFARGASTDMLLTAHFAAAMLAWWAWHETARKLWLALFYALLAFGALAKGPVAPGLAVLIVGVYALLQNNKKIFLRSMWWPGFLVFFLIALPWYVAVQMKVPQFFRVFFIEHNLERFGANVYHHSQPFWYYLPVFLLSTLPWTVFTILAIVEACRSKVWQRKADTPASEHEHRLHLFLLLWIVIPVVFFSISRSKLPGYILPAIPPAALLTAEYLHRKQRSVAPWSLTLHSVICGALVGAALLVPSRMLKLHPTPGGQIAVLIGASLTAVVVLILARVGRSRQLHLATLIPVIVIVAFLLGPAAPVIDDVNSARPVDGRLRQLGGTQGPVAVFNVKRELEYGLNFYRNQPIARYERDGVPARNHVVIAQEGSQAAVQAVAGERHVVLLGSFPPQHLEFFSVSNR